MRRVYGIMVFKQVGESSNLMPTNNQRNQYDAVPEPTLPMNPVVVLWPVTYLVLLIIIPYLYGRWHGMPSYVHQPFGSVPVSVVWYGALGGVTLSLHGIFVHNQSWQKSYSIWHAFSGIVGAVYGIFSYLALVVLVSAASKTSVNVDNAVVYNLAAFVLGYSQHQFQDLLYKVTSTLFGPGTVKRPGVQNGSGGNGSHNGSSQ